MKKLLLILSVIFCQVSFAQEDGAYFYQLTPSVTTLGPSSTNATAGTIFKLNQPCEKVHIWAQASGVPANTDGSGAITFKIATASGSSSVTNKFDSAAFSTVKLVLSNGLATATAAAPIVGSIELSTVGVKYLVVGQIENTYTGAGSNFVVIVGLPKF